MNTEEKGPAEVDGTNPEEPRYTTAEEMNPTTTPKALNVQLPLSEMIRLRLFVVADQFKGTPKGEEVAQVIDTLRGVAQLQVLPKEGGGITYKWNTRKGYTHEQTKAALSTSWVYITVCWLYAIPTGQPDVDESLRTLREKESERYPITVAGTTPEADAMAEELGRRGFAVSRTDEHDQQDGPEEASTMNVNPDEKGLIRVSQGFVTNTHGGFNLFTDLETAKRAEIPKIGFDLNATETAVCDAALAMFHDTGYRGHGSTTLADSLLRQGVELSDRHSPARIAIERYPSIPFVRFTLAEMTRRAGMNPKVGGDRDKVKAAIQGLTRRHFVCSWKHLQQTRGTDGIWRTDPDGKHVIRTHEGPLFTLSTTIPAESLGDTGATIELHATAVLLDQVNETFGGLNYLMIPRTLVDDIRKARKELRGTEGKQVRGDLLAPTYRFLLYLHERVKQRNKRAGHILRVNESWQDVARIAKLPKSVIDTQTVRAQAILLEIYSTAKALGYLSNFERITSGKAAYRRGIRDILTIDARAFQPKGVDTSADSSPKALPDGGISGPVQRPEKRGSGQAGKRPRKGGGLRG